MQIPTIGFDHKKTNQAESEIFDLETLYQREYKDHSPQRPYRITFFMMVYIERGSGTHMVDFKSYPFESGSIVFVRREQAHCFDFASQPVGKVVIFTQEFLDQVHVNMRLPNYTPTHLTAKQMIDAFVTIEMNRRLVVSSVTTQQLAYDFGFEDASNFVKYFKNQADMTPS